MPVKTVAATAVIIGATLIGLAQCSEPAHAGNVNFHVSFEGLKDSHKLHWSFTCVDKCEGGKKEAERLADAPHGSGVVFQRAFPEGRWIVAVTDEVQRMPELATTPAACTATRTITTCGREEMCQQELDFVCRQQGG